MKQRTTTEVLKGVRAPKMGVAAEGDVYQIVIEAAAVVVYFKVEKVAPIISRINLGLLALSWSIRDITSGNYIGCEI